MLWLGADLVLPGLIHAHICCVWVKYIDPISLVAILLQAMGSHPLTSFPNDGGYLTLLRQIEYDPRTKDFVTNPVDELAGLRNGTLVNSTGLHLEGAVVHELAGTGGGAAASADIMLHLVRPSPTTTTGRHVPIAPHDGGSMLGGAVGDVNLSLTTCVLADPGGNSGVAVAINVSTALQHGQ